MTETVSISKGVFVFKNGFQKLKRGRGKKKTVANVRRNTFSDTLWYQSYYSLWNDIEKKIQILNEDMFSRILSSLVDFVKTCYDEEMLGIPTATLLTGINMPDHEAQFSALARELNKKVTPHVATLNSQDCGNLKHLIENMIMQLRNDPNVRSGEDDDDEEEYENIRIKKSCCNFSVLHAWYEDLYDSTNCKPIVLIISDFERFSEKVLQEFILILSSYKDRIPFVLIFGVATSLSAIHKSLPYKVSSKVNMRVFHSQPSITYLNNILESIFFSSSCPFHLGGKLFTLFTDIFLFYDFSVTGFIQNIKYAMLEHYSAGNARALCTNPSKFETVLEKFQHADYENVRALMSFRTYVEAEKAENRIKLLTNDQYLKSVLLVELRRTTTYLNAFHAFIKCLHVLAVDLPKTPLGKHVRELYNVAVRTEVVETPQFKEAFQLLNFQAKDEMLKKIKHIQSVLRKEAEKGNTGLFLKTCTDLEDLLQKIDTQIKNGGDDVDKVDPVEKNWKMDRAKLKEQLLEMSKQNDSTNKYEKLHQKLLDYLQELFKKHLANPKTFVFHEIFFSNDVTLQNNIVGCHRAAIHMALNDPISYLSCTCCGKSSDAAILSCMPDICIAYKLHLEHGKVINLYDWLQAFLSILDPVETGEDERKQEVDPRLQARFTQCVAELEFLGFIKSSKRKMDCVARLTWGG